MSYSLAHVWSGVRSRLRDPNAAEPAAITVEANHALNELRGRIRQSREDWLDTIEKTDVLADKDVYDYPEALDTLKMIERLDLASEQGASPSYGMSYYERYGRDVAATTQLAVSNTFSILPGRRVQVQPTPTTSMVDGLRWTFLPKMSPLINPDDVVAGLPDQFFEWLIVGTVDRMRQFRGIELSDPKAYETFRREQTARLTQELRPAALATPPHIIDEDEYYQLNR